MNQEPKRAHRSDWWAEWDGQEHAVGHFRWVDWETLTYCDRDPGEARDTPRALKGIVLLKETGVLIIQRHSDDMSFKGWHSVWEIEDLEVRGPGFWFRCKLGKRLR